MTRVMRFLPALFFLLIWMLVINQGLGMKKAMQAPVGSDQFIRSIGRGIDNPWTHISALRIYFLSLRRSEAPAYIWANSLPFSWDLWHQYQYSGSVEIMLLVAHASGNRIEEQYWAKKYAIIEPDVPRVHRLLKVLLSSPNGKVPMVLLGPW